VTTDLWTSRDLPVLRAIVAAIDATRPGYPIRVSDLTVEGLTSEEIQRSVNALAQAGTFFTGTDGAWGHPHLFIHGVTEHARQRAGVWPTPADDLAERLIGAFQAAADAAEGEKKTKLKAALTGLKGLSRDVLVEVISSMISQGVVG